MHANNAAPGSNCPILQADRERKAVHRPYGAHLSDIQMPVVAMVVTDLRFSLPGNRAFPVRRGKLGLHWEADQLELREGSDNHRNENVR